MKIIHGISGWAKPFVSLMTDFSVHKHKFSSGLDTRGNTPQGALDHQQSRAFHFRDEVQVKTNPILRIYGLFFTFVTLNKLS